MPRTDEQRPQRPADPAAVVGDVRIEGSLGADALGEVLRGSRAGTPLRVRLVQGRDEGAALAERLERVRDLGSPYVAPVLGVLVDGSGRVAVLGDPDATTLQRRLRAGPLDTVTAVRLGTALCTGIADLHAAGIVHGAPQAASVGVDARGRPRWQDAGVAPPRRVAPEQADVVALAAVLRRLPDLPATLRSLADATAGGTPGAPGTAADLLARWRDAAGRGPAAPATAAALPGLLEVPPRAPRPRRRARPALPGWGRPAGAVLAALAAVAVFPAAGLSAAGRPPLGALADYRVTGSGHHLGYTLTQLMTTGTATVRAGLHVQDDAVVDGVPTTTVVPDAAGGVALPLGLSGATLRVQDGGLRRGIGGGVVRDLILPLDPGTEWTDTHAATGGFVTTERRRLLGPASLDEPAGHFEHCAVVALDVSTRETATGSAGSAATATLWYCPGVGLARAVIESTAERDTIDLAAVQ